MTTALKDAATAAGLVKHTHTTELATVQTGIPVGIEDMDDRDLKIGSVILVQDALKVFTKKGIKPGEFVNTVTEKKVEDTTFIPAYMTKTYLVYSYKDPTKVSGEFLFDTKDENDPRLNGLRRRQEGTLKAEVIPCIKTVALISGQPVMISFKKSAGYGAGKKLYTFARDAARTANLPLWGQKYRLASQETKNKVGIEYWEIVLDVVGPTTPEEQSLAQSLFNGFKAKTVEVAGEPEADTVPF